MYLTVWLVIFNFIRQFDFLFYLLWERNRLSKVSPVWSHNVDVFFFLPIMFTHTHCSCILLCKLTHKGILEDLKEDFPIIRTLYIHLCQLAVNLVSSRGQMEMRNCYFSPDNSYRPWHTKLVVAVCAIRHVESASELSVREIVLIDSSV